VIFVSPKQASRAGVGEAKLGLRALGELRGGRRFEFDSDERLVADDPGVVTGLDDVRVARSGICLAAVFMNDVKLPTDDGAEVARLA
jgi:hypothetical protein